MVFLEISVPIAFVSLLPTVAEGAKPVWKGLVSSRVVRGEWVELPNLSTIRLNLRTLFLLAQRQPWMTSVLRRQIWKTPKWTVAEGLRVRPRGGTSSHHCLCLSTD